MTVFKDPVVDGVFTVILAALGIAALIFVWPISFWLGAALIALGVVRLVKEVDARGEGTVAGWLQMMRAVVLNVSASLDGMLFFAAIGVAFVCAEQVVLRAVGHLVSPTTLFEMERFLAQVQASAGFLFAPEFVVAVFGILFVLLVLDVRVPAIGLLVRYRGRVGKVLSLLGTISAFTFFSGQAISHNSREWTASLEKRGEQALNSLRQAQNQVAAQTLVKQMIDEASPEQRQNLADGLRRTVVDSYQFRRAAIVKDIVASVGEAMRNSQPEAAEQPRPAVSAESDRAELWKSVDAEGGRTPEDWARIAEGADEAARELKTVAGLGAEAITGALSLLFEGLPEELVKARVGKLVNAIVGGVAVEVLQKSLPEAARRLRPDDASLSQFRARMRRLSWPGNGRRPRAGRLSSRPRERQLLQYSHRGTDRRGRR